MGSGRHHYSPGLFLPFLPQPPPWQPLSSQRVGWCGEEGADPGGGDEGQKRPCLPFPSPPTPSPLPEGQQPHILSRQGPGVARAGKRHTRARESPVPGRGHTEPSAQEAGLGGFPLRLRRNSPMVQNQQEWPWKSSSPLLHGTDEETKACRWAVNPLAKYACCCSHYCPGALLSWLVLLPGLRSHTLQERCPPATLASWQALHSWRGCKHLLVPFSPEALTCLLGVGFLSSHCHSTAPRPVHSPSSSQLFKLGFTYGRRSCARQCPARHRVSSRLLLSHFESEGEERKGMPFHSPCLQVL